jgi:hypothetical protein
MLDLFWTTLLSGVTLLALGIAYLVDPPKWRAAVQAFPRSQGAAYVTMGIGGAWFLYKMWNLGPQDALFGPKTNLIFVIVFGLAWAGSFAVMRDFLSVRGLCVLLLMIAFSIIEGPAHTRYEFGALFLKAVVYLFVVISIWWGVSPFRARDFNTWLYAGPSRSKLVGSGFAAVGALMSALAFTL